MTLTLKFKPKVEAGLLAHAQASGMTVQEYVLSVVEGAVLPAAQKTLSQRNERLHMRRGLPIIAPPLPCLTSLSAAKPCMKVVTAEA